jgi:hypothetical protein
MKKINLKIVSMVLVILLSSFFIFPSIILAAQNSSGGGDNSGLVKYVYEQILDREPSQSEINSWINNFNKGSASAYTLVNTAMFGAERGSQVNAMNNKDYIYFLYACLFQRTPDLDGLNAWYNRLQSGKRKNEIIQGFVVSQEFANLCGEFGVKPYFSREINGKTIAALYSIGSSSGAFTSIDTPQEETASSSSSSSTPVKNTSPSSKPPKTVKSVYHHAGESCSKCH